jgi:hypothetical protein
MLPSFIEIKQSNLHGVGVFTTESFEKDAVIFYGKRKTITVNNPDEPVGNIAGHEIIPRMHCPQLSANTYHLYTFDSFMNHSYNANTKVIYVDDDH